jgi:hypothetical protein
LKFVDDIAYISKNKIDLSESLSAVIASVTSVASVSPLWPLWAKKKRGVNFYLWEESRSSAEATEAPQRSERSQRQKQSALFSTEAREEFFDFADVYPSVSRP